MLRTALLANLAFSIIAQATPNSSPANVTGQPNNYGAAALSPPSYPPREAFFVNGSSEVKQPPSTQHAAAIYTMSNSADGNVLLAIPVNTNNGLINTTAPVVSYPINGTGARFPAPNGDSSLQSALDSQGSVVQAGARLFVVNAGSNTFQTFAIDCFDATKLVYIGQPVQVQGNNPNAIAVDSADSIVCVATTGNSTGIECYTYNTGFGESEVNTPEFLSGTNVPLPLPVNQTGPLPTSGSDTVSQLLVSDDNKILIAVVKGAISSSGAISGGYINVYAITSDGLGAPTTSQPSGTALLSGCVLQYDTYNLFCADASTGAVFLSFDSSTSQYTVTESTPASQFGNGRNAWTARSPYLNGPNYMSGEDSSYIAAFNKTTNELINGTNSEKVFKTHNPNLGELAAASNYVYGLSYGNETYPAHVTVVRDLNLAGNLHLAQNFKIPGVGQNVNGVAVFVPLDEANTCNFT